MVESVSYVSYHLRYKWSEEFTISGQRIKHVARQFIASSWKNPPFHHTQPLGGLGTPPAGWLPLGVFRDSPGCEAVCKSFHWCLLSPKLDIHPIYGDFLKNSFPSTWLVFLFNLTRLSRFPPNWSPSFRAAARRSRRCAPAPWPALSPPLWLLGWWRHLGWNLAKKRQFLRGFESKMLNNLSKML